MNRSHSRAKKEIEKVKKVVYQKQAILNNKSSEHSLSSLIPTPKPKRNTTKRSIICGEFISSPYYNFAGKKVRDQATQTIKTDEKIYSKEGIEKNNEIKSDRSTTFSSNSLNEYDKNNENSFMLKTKKNLPRLSKNFQFLVSTSKHLSEKLNK